MMSGPSSSNLSPLDCQVWSSAGVLSQDAQKPKTVAEFKNALQSVWSAIPRKPLTALWNTTTNDCRHLCHPTLYTWCVNLYNRYQLLHLIKYHLIWLIFTKKTHEFCNKMKVVAICTDICMSLVQTVCSLLLLDFLSADCVASICRRSRSSAEQDQSLSGNSSNKYRAL